MDSLGLTYALIGAVAVVCLVPFFLMLCAKKADLFEPVGWASAYFLLLFVLRPLYDVTLGSEFLGEAPFDQATGDAFNLGLIYALLSFCVFMVGYYSNLGVLFARVFPRLPVEWNGGRIKIAWPLILGFGFISYVLLVNFFGGWTYYIEHKQETLTAPGQGYFLLSTSMILIAFAMKLTCSLESPKRGYAVLGLFFLILLLIGFFSGSKGLFLMPVMVVVVAVYYMKNGIRFRHLLYLLAFILFLFPVFNTYRNYSADDQGQVVSDNKGGARFLIEHGMSRFYGIDSLTLVVRDTPMVMDYQLGETILPLFVAWIPRQLWEDKPTISFGKIFAETYMGDFFSGTGTSASPTLLGEAYLNWHIPGMLLVALFGGVIIRSFYVWLIQLNFGAPAVFIYSQFFLYLFMFWEVSIAGFLAERIASLSILMAIVFALGRCVEIDNKKNGG
ncbi:MAG: oligosaccharide repeat unit polymerase [Rhodoferax sp.]